MVPSADLRPETLPTARLSVTGRPAPELRADLRRIAGFRNVLTVAGAWAQVAAVVGGAVWLDTWWGWIVAFALMARSFALLAILAHEAAHRMLFNGRRSNDLVGRWLLAYPAFIPFDQYRRVHMAHHRDEMGPDEPDLGLYAGYPISRASLRRKLGRDAVGISGWKNLRPLLVALTRPSSRRVAVSIVAVQLALAAALTLAGWPQLYLLVWLGPWLTGWRVNNRLRAIAEHGGMVRSPDRRATTHLVRQHLVARFWMVPYHTGWHLAHHVDAGIPWRNLPRLQAELAAAGWIPPGLAYPSYRALWRALAERPT